MFELFSVALLAGIFLMLAIIADVLSRILDRLDDDEDEDYYDDDEDDDWPEPDPNH